MSDLQQYPDTPAQNGSCETEPDWMPHVRMWAFEQVKGYRHTNQPDRKVTQADLTRWAFDLANDIRTGIAPPKPATLHCSFCGKSQHEVRKLIAGPAPVFICDECAELCVDIVRESAAQESTTPSPVSA